MGPLRPVSPAQNEGAPTPQLGLASPFVSRARAVGQDYSCELFFEDCKASFPELALYVGHSADASSESQGSRWHVLGVSGEGLAQASVYIRASA